MIERAATGADLEIKAHPHMAATRLRLRPGRQGHDTRAIQGWLGQRSITSTAVYTALAPNRFKGLIRGQTTTEAAVDGQKSARRRFNEGVQEGREGHGQSAHKKRREEDRENHQALV
jgi:hypothetical protein